MPDRPPHESRGPEPRAPEAEDRDPHRRAIRPGPPDPTGWRELEVVPAEPRVVRTDLVDGVDAAADGGGGGESGGAGGGGGGGGGESAGPSRPLLSFLHLSDLHVMDAQSPARFEYLDRQADPDSPLRERFPSVGCCRPQDMLSPHLVEAMVRALNAAAAAHPHEVAFAVATGDLTDNAQVNELTTYLTLLGGGKVEPDSGDSGRYQGVAASDPATWDERYWHPDGPPPGFAPDRPTRRYGYPTVPGLLDAARRPFAATGLGVGWYAVHGNHDALLQGTVAADDVLRGLAVGAERLTGLDPALDPAEVLTRAGEIGPARYPDSTGAPRVPITPDPRRALVDRREFVAAHLPPDGSAPDPAEARAAGRGPAGHGFTAANLRDGTTYWSADVPADDGTGFRLIALDTVNPHGGWQGSLDRDQFGWLEAELRAVSSRWLDPEGRIRTGDVADRLVIVASHHPSHCLTNGYRPANGDDAATSERVLADRVLSNRDDRVLADRVLGDRVLGEEVVALLLRYPNVVLWVDGHTHAHQVRPHARPAGAAIVGGFWEVTTSSVIDWPQQARVVDVRRTAGGLLAVDTAVVDHAGAPRPPAGPSSWPLDDPADLAGLARALSVNFWQWRDLGVPDLLQGGPADRDTTLLLPAPFPSTA